MARKSTPEHLSDFRRRLLRWFRRHGRDLPWRRTRDPYHVIVSEFMLQQTQVARVEAYYHRFLEQYPSIDALESLGRSPASHLVIPRVLAGFIMIPALTVLANLSGVVAGWLSVKAVLPVTDADFIYGAQYYWRPWDAWYSVIKAFFFAGSITIIACYMGFNTQQGAEGVGKSTTAAIVTSSVVILLLNFLLAKILLSS